MGEPVWGDIVSGFDSDYKNIVKSGDIRLYEKMYSILEELDSEEQITVWDLTPEELISINQANLAYKNLPLKTK